MTGPTLSRAGGDIVGDAMQLRTDVSSLDGWTVVTVYGELDVASAPTLRERLIDLVSGGSHLLVLDLEGLDFLDSTGLGAIISALKRARTNGGDLRLVCTQSRIRRLFEITALDKAFPLFPSLDDAIKG
jgi:anti-sigma B factor antagonist